MKYNVTQFKSMKVALKELEPYFRNVAVGKNRRPVLESGRPIKRFGNCFRASLSPTGYLLPWAIS